MNFIDPELRSLVQRLADSRMRYGTTQPQLLALLNHHPLMQLGQQVRDVIHESDSDQGPCFLAGRNVGGNQVTTLAQQVCDRSYTQQTGTHDNLYSAENPTAG